MKKVKNMIRILVVFLMFWIYLVTSLASSHTTTSARPSLILPEEIVWDTVKATKYNAVASQCGPNPGITASGAKIDMEALRNHDLRWLAISRDLVGKYQFGDTVVLECKNHRLNGEWVVMDLMPSKWKMKIDLLVPVGDKYEFHAPKRVRIKKK